MPVIIHLDKKTQKIWDSLPRGERSTTIRKLLLSLSKAPVEDEPKKEAILRLLKDSLENIPGSQEITIKQGTQLSRMAHILKSKKKSSLEGSKGDIRKLLGRASS